MVQRDYDKWFAGLKEPLKTAMLRSMTKPMRNHLECNYHLTNIDQYVNNFENAPDGVQDVICGIYEKLTNTKQDEILEAVQSRYITSDMPDKSAPKPNIKKILDIIAESYRKYYEFIKNESDIDYNHICEINFQKVTCVDCSCDQCDCYMCYYFDCECKYCGARLDALNKKQINHRLDEYSIFG